MKVIKFDSKTGILTVEYTLHKGEPSKSGGVMNICQSTSGFTDLPGVEVEGKQLRISTTIGYKR